jgi:hypothetical protein
MASLLLRLNAKKTPLNEKNATKLMISHKKWRQPPKNDVTNKKITKFGIIVSYV